MDKVDIDVIVWNGPTGEDNKLRRHAALFLIEPGKRKGDAVQVRGSPTTFEVICMEGYNPDTSINIASRCHICQVPKPLLEVRSICMATPANNDDNGWNCQNFVGDMLNRLVSNKMITVADKDAAVDFMVDAILEGADQNKS
ncbi:hypothetical protein MauCBS54593_006651 [Microsporum audouinii]